MKRAVVVFLLLASMVLCAVGTASAAFGGIDPFTMQTVRVGR